MLLLMCWSHKLSQKSKRKEKTNINSDNEVVYYLFMRTRELKVEFWANISLFFLSENDGKIHL